MGWVSSKEIVRYTFYYITFINIEKRGVIIYDRNYRVFINGYSYVG